MVGLMYSGAAVSLSHRESPGSGVKRWEGLVGLGTEGSWKSQQSQGSSIPLLRAVLQWDRCTEKVHAGTAGVTMPARDRKSLMRRGIGKGLALVRRQWAFCPRWSQKVQALVSLRFSLVAGLIPWCEHGFVRTGRISYH